MEADLISLSARMITLERILISFTAPMMDPDQFDRWVDATKQNISVDPEIHNLVRPQVISQLDIWKQAVRKVKSDATPA